MVEAGRLVLDDGRAEATDGVRIALSDGQVLDAERAVVSSAGWSLEQARWTEGSLVLSAEGVTGAGRRWTATDLSVDPCACEDPSPVRLTARAAELDDGRLHLTRPRLTVGEHTVFGLPRWSLPVERASGLLWPTVRHGPDGWWLATPVYLAPRPSWDLTLTPELRTRLGMRGLAGARWNGAAGEGSLDAFGAWSEVRPEATGARAAWDHRGPLGPLTLASTGTAWTDPEVGATWGRDQVSRHQDWTEQRAWLGRGGTGLWTDTFQTRADRPWDETRSVPLGLVASTARTAGAPTNVVSLRADSAVVTHPSEDPFLVGRLSARGSTVSWTGPMRWTAVGEAAWGGTISQAASNPTLGTSGQAFVRGGLPVWRRRPGALERLDPGVAVGMVRTAEGGRPTLRPELTWSRVTEQARTTGSGAVHWSAEGLEGTADLWLERPHLTAQLDLHVPIDAPEQARWVAVAGPRSPRAGLVALSWRVPAEEGTPLDTVGGRAWVTGPGPLSVLRLEGDVLVDLPGGETPALGGALTWTHRSGCAAVRTTLRRDGDRGGVDAGVAVELWPGVR